MAEIEKTSKVTSQNPQLQQTPAGVIESLGPIVKEVSDLIHSVQGVGPEVSDLIHSVQGIGPEVTNLLKLVSEIPNAATKAATELAPIVPKISEQLGLQVRATLTESVEKFAPGAIKDFFQDLYPEQQILLYKRLELEKGLTINTIQSEDQDWVISKALKKAIVWTSEVSPTPKNPKIIEGTLIPQGSPTPKGSDQPYHPDWSVPEKIAYFKVNVETSYISRAVAKFSSKGSSSQELSLFGSLDAKANMQSSGSSSFNATSKSYLLAEYTRPKLILSVDWKNIQLTHDFHEKLEIVLNKDKWSNFLQLNTLLNEYGYFVPLKFTLGGKISKQLEVNSQISANSKTTSSFQSDFASQLNLSGMSGKGNMSSQSEMESNQNMSSESNLDLEYSGGIGSAMNILGWIRSLDSYKTWQVIKYDDLTPIICFFPDELRNKAITVFIRYSYYPDTDKPLLLNSINYASRALDLINRQKLLSKGSQPKTVDKKKKKIDNFLKLSYKPASNQP